MTINNETMAKAIAINVLFDSIEDLEKEQENDELIQFVYTKAFYCFSQWRSKAEINTLPFSRSFFFENRDIDIIISGVPKKYHEDIFQACQKIHDTLINITGKDYKLNGPYG